MRRDDDASDEELLHAGDPDGGAFARFYQRHVRAVLASLAREDVDAATAADVVADTFLTALQHRHAFDAERGTGRAWLLGIMRHRLADHRRGARRVQRLQELLRAELPALRTEDRDAYDALRLRGDLEAVGDPRITTALDELSPSQRHAVVARVVHDVPYADLARTMRLPEPTVRQHVSRALTRMRRRLTD